MLRALTTIGHAPRAHYRTHRDWRTLRLADAASVEALNRLLRDRWSVIAVNVDGMSYLPAARAASASVEAAALHRTARVDVVLGREEESDDTQQSAVFVGRTASGRARIETMPLRMHGWVRTLVIVVGTGDAIVLYEREP